MSASLPVPHRILVVEDDAALRSVLTRVLTRSGHDVVSASEGMEGLRRVADCVPDLVLTDIIMDGMEGVEMITTLKRSHPRLKIIAMSGGGRLSPADRLKMAKSAGADAALVKPFEPDDLLALIKDMLAP